MSHLRGNDPTSIWTLSRSGGILLVDAEEGGVSSRRSAPGAPRRCAAADRHAGPAGAQRARGRAAGRRDPWRAVPPLRGPRLSPGGAFGGRVRAAGGGDAVRAGQIPARARRATRRGGTRVCGVRPGPPRVLQGDVPARAELRPSALQRGHPRLRGARGVRDGAAAREARAGRRPRAARALLLVARTRAGFALARWAAAKSVLAAQDAEADPGDHRAGRQAVLDQVKLLPCAV